MVEEQRDDILGKLIVSYFDAPSKPDQASKGMVSRWLQHDSVRMRVGTLPAGYEADHICYKGHSIYVISGGFKMELEDSVLEWKEGDAFIIPDGVPHRLFNPSMVESKLVIFDNHV